MRVLLIDGYDPSDKDRIVTTCAREFLEESGHDVRFISVVTEGFHSPMSEAERLAYHHEGSNMLNEEVRNAAQQLLDAEAVLFCYPTTTFTVPAAVKNWFDRVMLPGVAFRLDEQGSLQPTLQHVGRIGLITTTTHGALATLRARDGGRRLVLRNLRMQCGRRCRRTFVKMPSGGCDQAKISKALASW